MGLFDFGGSGDPSGGLYGEFLTPQQKQALAFRGLQGFLGGMQKSGALNYEVPFISGRVPGGFAAGMAGGMAGMGAAQDEAAKNAMQAQLIGLQGQNLQSQIGARTSLNNAVDRYAPMLAGVGGAATSGTPAGSPDTVSPNSPGAFVKQHESEGLAAQLGIDPYHIGVGGADLSKAPKDENGFPIWEGNNGSHAAGAYQFQPATWAQYAKPLGIKDFSQASQDAVFRAAYLDQGYKPWAPYNPKIAAAVNSGTAPHAPASVQLASLNAAAPANDTSINPALLAPTDPRYQEWVKGQVASGNMPQGADNPTPRFATDTPFQPPPAPAGVPAASPGGLFGMPAPPTGGLFGAAPAAGSSPQATFSNLNVPRGGTGGPSPGVPASMLPQPTAAAPVAGGGAPQPGGIDPRASLLAYLGAKSSIAGLGDTFKPFETALYNSPTYKAAVAAAEAAGKLPYVGPTAAAEAAGKLPFTQDTVRPGSIHTMGGRPDFAAPVQVDAVDPATGRSYKTWTSPPLPGQNPGQSSMAPGPQASAAPGIPNGVMTRLGPGEEINLKGGAETQQEGFSTAKKQFGAAQDIQGRLYMMDHAIDVLNQNGGWSSTGSLANARIGFAKNVNSLGASMGLAPIFDPGKVATWEDLSKETTRAGFELAKTLGSREAMMIVQQATSAVPNAENTAAGARLVSSSLNQAAQRQSDFYSFLNQWKGTHAGSLDGADIAFNKMVPAQAYAAKAIAVGTNPQLRQWLAAVPPSSIMALQSDPKLAQQFDAKYGGGLAGALLAQ